MSMKIWCRKNRDPQQRAEAKAARKRMDDELGSKWDAADARVRVGHTGLTRRAIVYIVLTAVFCVGAVWIVATGGNFLAIILALGPAVLVYGYTRYVYNGGRLSLSTWTFEPPSNC